MEIILVRHGQTVANENNWYYGFTDSPMTAKGEEQARAAGTFIKAMGFEPNEIFRSERHRTRDTLTFMGFDDGRAKVDARLNEQHMGAFECMKYEEIEVKYPGEFTRWNDDFLNYEPPNGGESHGNFYNRVKKFWLEMLERKDLTEEKRILIVTHGGVMHSTYAYINGDSQDSYYSVFFHNCSIMRLKFMRDRFVIDALYSPQELLTWMGKENRSES